MRKMAAEKLFPFVQTGQMSANDAFSKLLKKIKGKKSGGKEEISPLN